MIELLWLLLPVAAASGWIAAKSHYCKVRNEREPFNCGPDYYKGLNYLLNEQPDKAIEVFTNMLNIDSETVETHIALGNLFRKRGEVDRSIRIHQNLIARSNISQTERDQALFELGQDYLKAGLYDRAESLFKELVESESLNIAALKQLIIIFEKEKDWQNAIQFSQQLQALDYQEINSTIAQYYCELVEISLSEGKQQEAINYLNQARQIDPNCVRAAILMGNHELENGHYQNAISSYQKVKDNFPEYFPEVLKSLRTSYEQLNDEQTLIAQLKDFLDQNYNNTVLLEVSDIIRHKENEHIASAFMIENLCKHPSLQGLEMLISFKNNHQETFTEDSVIVIKELIAKIIKNKPTYQCMECGFNSKKLYWQCPRCNSWSSIKPIQNNNYY